jgi:beta-galactosidase/beta-glucuronidase
VTHRWRHCTLPIPYRNRIGLNLARKHVKVEPDRWYYWCDKLGLLVWQDMPSFSPKPDYEQEMPRIIAALCNHPCIVVWVMMNEGYSSRQQQETASALARKNDPTRLVTATSGWRDMGLGDLIDRHDYWSRRTSRHRAP